MENNVNRLVNLVENIIINNENFHRNMGNVIELHYTYLNTSLSMLREERECIQELSYLISRMYEQSQRNQNQDNTNSEINEETNEETTSETRQLRRERTVPQRELNNTTLFSNNTSSFFSSPGNRFLSYLNPQTRFLSPSPNRRVLPTRPQGGNTRANNFMNIFNLLRDNLSRNSQVVPLTEEEINNNCTRALLRDISSNITSCPIDLAEIQPDEYILKINQCGHVFRESNLRRVFETSSLCPLCRHNLRSNNSSFRTSNVTNLQDLSDNFVSLEASFTLNPSSDYFL